MLEVTEAVDLSSWRHHLGLDSCLPWSEVLSFLVNGDMAELDLSTEDLVAGAAVSRVEPDGRMSRSRERL